MVLRNIGEWNEFRFTDNVTVLEADLFPLHFDESIRIYRLTVDCEFDSVRLGEVLIVAWTIAWHRVEVVWSVFSIFTSLVEHRVCNVEVTFLV